MKMKGTDSTPRFIEQEGDQGECLMYRNFKDSYTSAEAGKGTCQRSSVRSGRRHHLFSMNEIHRNVD
jgi:hypothetical protein